MSREGVADQGEALLNGGFDGYVRYPNLSGQESQHKSHVEPVFLAYNKVSRGDQWVTLMQIACAIVDALNDTSAIDVV